MEFKGNYSVFFYQCTLKSVDNKQNTTQNLDICSTRQGNVTSTIKFNLHINELSPFRHIKRLSGIYASTYIYILQTI